MTRYTLLLLPALALAACAGDAVESAGAPAAEAPELAVNSGEVVTLGTAPGTADVMPAALAAERAADLAGQTVRVEGTVAQVCQVKGCWLTLETGGDPIRVAVPKDEAGEYVYTFPTDIGGRRATLEGTLAVEETSVETLRHLAEDEGQTPEEVAAITAPKREVTLTATGARLRPAAEIQA